MTEKEMHKLADIIEERIRKIQKEMDQQFFQDATQLNEAWGIAAIDPAEKAALEAEYDIVMEQLQSNLQEALAQENYELAAVIKKKIEDLKNRGTE